jgi:PAS domain S-box-containing protein
MPDPDGGAGGIHELLTKAVDEAARLLDADGAMVYLIDPTTGNLRFAHDAGIRSERSRVWVRGLELAPGTGMFGRAVVERGVVVTDDYGTDPSFRHATGTDRVVADIGIRSMVVAPLVAGDQVFGALGTFSTRAGAFDQAQIALVRSLADHAAVAMANTRLIEDLDRSTLELAERAEAERTLRDINVRISAAADLSSVLQLAVDEAARLLQADGARIDLVDAGSGLLRWAYASGALQPDDEIWPDDPDETLDQGISGQAVVQSRPFWTGDYQHDERFPHGRGADTYVEASGIRSVMAAPLVGESGAFGALTTFTHRADAWSEAEAGVLEAIAAQAAIAIARMRLIGELERSREENAQRAEAERTLREIAARVSSILDPATVLTQIVAESARLLGSDGARIDLWDERIGALRWAYSTGEAMSEVPEWGRTGGLKPRQAVAGLAFHEQRPVMTEDFLADDRFDTTPEIEAFVRKAGIRAVIAAPLSGEGDEPLGVLSVVSRQPGAYTDTEVELLTALATHASIAMTNAHLMEELARSREDIERRADTNARLIEELERSRLALARRAETERSLRDITARIAALTDPDEVLERVVKDARRLLSTDGAHLTRMGPTGTYLVPVVVAGAGDDATREWLMGMEFPLGAGINGLAAQSGEPVWTFDYLADPRIPHEPDDQAVAERLALRGMAAAPLRAPGGEVMGTLAISTSQPRIFEADDLDLLQGLADQAAITLTNSNLLARMTESEERYRFLVQNAPDLVWSIGPDARITFLSHAVERLTGFRPDELIGQHFGAIVHESSRDVAEIDWTEAMRTTSEEVRGRLSLRHRDGSAVPAEFVAIASLDADGAFLGANGSVRDMRERDRLERELRASEDRYRTLASSSPDLVFATDAEGRYTFLSDRAQTVLGWDKAASLGRHFMEFVAPGFEAVAAASYEEVVTYPDLVHSSRVDFLDGSGRPIPLDINIVGKVEDGVLVGINGVARDMSERTRLERELRRQAGELAAGEERAHLARELHDSVTQALFSMTLVSRSAEMLLATDPEAARTHLTQLRELQREALAEMRALIFELRPGNLESDGLVRALKTHSAALQGRLGLPVVVESDLEDRLPLAAEEVLYRIAQEALHNVVKHAAARQVSVQVQRADGGVRLRVEDDGKGFDPTSVPDGHLGLAGMRARAERVGATFACQSKPGKGTSIEVALGPLALAELQAAAAIGEAATAELSPIETPSIRDG